jgi:site-specific recombinase XerD
MPGFGSLGPICFSMRLVGAVPGASFTLAADLGHARGQAPLRVSQNDSSRQAVFLGQLGEEGAIYSQSSSRGSEQCPQLVGRAARAAGFDMKIHPHMLRHSCGYKLANDGVDTRTIQSYLGHKSIQHTVRYTELAPTRFNSLFRD